MYEMLPISKIAPAPKGTTKRGLDLGQKLCKRLEIKIISYAYVYMKQINETKENGNIGTNF